MCNKKFSKFTILVFMNGPLTPKKDRQMHNLTVYLAIIS